MEELLESLFGSPQNISALFEQYKPIIYMVCKELFGLYKDLVNNDDYYDTCALGNWKRFSALTKVGFTEEQAMQIIVNEIKEFNDYAKRTSGTSVKLKV